MAAHPGARSEETTWAHGRRGHTRADHRRALRLPPGRRDRAGPGRRQGRARRPGLGHRRRRHRGPARAPPGRRGRGAGLGAAPGSRSFRPAAAGRAPRDRSRLTRLPPSFPPAAYRAPRHRLQHPAGGLPGAASPPSAPRRRPAGRRVTAFSTPPAACRAPRHRPSSPPPFPQARSLRGQGRSCRGCGPAPGAGRPPGPQPAGRRPRSGPPAGRRRSAPPARRARSRWPPPHCPRP